MLKGPKAILEKKEAQIKGDAWMAQVSSDKMRFNAFDDWKAKYEPTKEKTKKSEFQKKTEAHIVSKAKAVILSKVQEGISAKLVLVILEITSKVLSKVESHLREANKEEASIVADLVNAANGAVLTFRFQKSHPRQMNFFRTKAADRITALAISSLQIGESASTQMLLIGKAIHVELSANKEYSRAMAAEKLYELLLTAIAMGEDAALTTIESQLSKAEIQVNDVVSRAPPPIIKDVTNKLEKAKAVVDRQMEAMASTKNEIAATVIAFVKHLILSQMDQLIEIIGDTTDTLLTYLGVVMIEVEKKKKSEDEFKTLVSVKLDSTYETMVTSVADKVHQVINVLGSMMEDSSDDVETTPSN